MDQGHGDSIGAWDAGTFATEGWDHHFNGSGLAFDQGGGADSGYPNPDFLGGGSMNSQLSGPDPQAGLYRQFGYPYGQGDVWSDHAQPAAAQYGQDPSLHQPQAYYAEQGHPSDANQTVDSRFALNIQQGSEFPVQLNTTTSQQAKAHHGFGNGVANARNSAPDGYPQGSLPQWQGQVSSGYGSGHQYENPLAASQAPNISAPVPTGSPSPFFSNHGPAIPAYQTEVYQQTPANARPAHPQFGTAVNGQTQQQPVSVPSRSPAQPAQPVAHSVAPQQLPPQKTRQQVQQQTAFQPAPQQAPQPAPQPAPRQAPQQAPQPIAGQSVFVQQPINQSQPSPEKNSAVGVKRGSTSEFQAGPVVTKKAKVIAPVALNSASPVPQPQSERGPEPICTINHEDTALLAEVRRRPEAKWVGVPNLVIGSAPVKLQKGTPTKRYVVLSTKGGKDPLFPKLWRGWTPAESLGNHADAYQKATSDLDRQRADIRLELEMKRGQTGKLHTHLSRIACLVADVWFQKSRWIGGRKC